MLLANNYGADSEMIYHKQIFWLIINKSSGQGAGRVQIVNCYLWKLISAGLRGNQKLQFSIQGQIADKLYIWI